MTITHEQQVSLAAAAEPLIKWLNENCHPHCAVYVSVTHAELVEGIAAIQNHTHVKD